MFTTGLVLLALLVPACGESGKSVNELDQLIDESLNKMKMLAAEEAPSWPESYDEEMFGLPDETASSEPQITKEQAGNSAVWKVLLFVAVLLLALVGVLSTVYYLCVWRGGRMHYEPQKDIST